ncbi:hypothetical protein [Streptantibioticus ferralitis]|uniref:Uncharacterized protein n=1 Tax=Streptantibioticus ferralitis TaxID=236510 RepID=A0ABT5Z052_9ACTN|nr:hypothetical protein [Streptantibioticus ferralitis]MDF2257209.1 hypothetical protein [Streptantibioticus ferralitis]
MLVSHLIAAVYVQDPETREELVLLPGECPPAEIAVLITNPAAWDVPPPREVEVVGVEEMVDNTVSAPQDEEGETGGGKKSPPRRSRSSSA